MDRRLRRLATAMGAAALALVMSAGTGHAQEVNGSISYAGGVLTLDITPGSAGITALDSACPGSQVTITGQGTGFTQVGFGSQDTGAFTMSGGACAANGVPSGLMVMTLDSPEKYTDVDGIWLDWGSHSCSTMTGDITQAAAVVEFSVTGDCLIDAWHTGPMTYYSAGVLTTGLASQEVDQAVYTSAQQAQKCC